MTGLTSHEITQALESAPAAATGVLIVNLRAVRANYRQISAIAEGASVAGVVKANGYGVGAAEVSRSLQAEGCDTFFVATLGEGLALRDTMSPELARIYVLDGLLAGTAPAFASARLSPVLGSMAEIEEWAAFRDTSPNAPPAAVHVDTGMTRLGLPLAEGLALAENQELIGRLGLALVMSHLACADTPDHWKNEQQREAFAALASRFPGFPASLANSAGAFLGPSYRFDLIRPGIALYGGNPGETGPNPMMPVVSLFGRAVQVRWADAGETVGYGAGQTLTRKTRVVTVSAGYADGIARAVSASDNRGGPPVYAGKHRLPLLGRVSMDLMTFDATDAPESAVIRGGWVELLGDRVTVDDMARFAGTISYEILTSLGRRYHRVYAGA